MTIVTRGVGKKLKQKKGRKSSKMSSTENDNDSLSMLQHHMDDIVFSSDEEEEDGKLPASDKFNLSSYLDEIGIHERMNDDNNGRSQAQLSAQNDRSRRYNQAQKAIVDDFMTTLETMDGNKWQAMFEPVPFKGTDGQVRQVPRCFKEISGEKTRDKLLLCNKMVVDWQIAFNDVFISARSFFH